MEKLTMLPGELKELMADVARVKLQDFHLGRVLEKFATHLAHAHGLDTTEAPVSESVDVESADSESVESAVAGEEAGTTEAPKPAKGKK